MHRLTLPLLSLGLAWLAGCAAPLTELGVTPDLRGWPDAVDWQAAADETTTLLAGYLQIDTSNPPGNESEGARYLAAHLARAGIESEIVEVAPGRGSLIARLPGSGEQPPLCLLSHIDVATAAPGEWREGFGPFSGRLDDQGVLWGRGALDMKGMGALEVQALVWLKRLGVPLRRDVVLLAVADEEVDNLGMRQLVQQRWDRIGCSHLINEGGFGLVDALYEGQTAYAISVAEKGVLWVRMHVRGASGHGSTPRPCLAPARLLDALERIRRRDVDPRVDDSLVELLARVGEQGGGFKGFVLKRPVLMRWLATGQLMDKPGTRAALIDTIHITGLDTGDHPANMVPGEARALLDCRLLPGTSAEDMLARLAELTGHDPDIRFEVLHHAPATTSPRDDPLYRALARHAIRGQVDAVAGPALSIGFTDSMYARALGVRAYGLVPFAITLEEAETMHGADERVSRTNLLRGLRTLFAVVIEVAADLGGASAPPGPPRRPPAHEAP